NVAMDGAAALSHIFTAAGVYTITLTVTDDDGVSDTASVTVTANTAPVAALSATPMTGLVPLMVMFDASASTDAFGNIVDYSFDFGDGDSTSGASATVNHDYAAPGDYVVSLTVTDDNGATDTLTTDIRVNTVPVAALSLDVTLGLAPLAVTADASGSTDEFGTIVRYDWDFGDGTTLMDGGASASHTYTTTGVFTVTVTVTDDDGASSTASAMVTADAAPIAALDLSATMFLLPNTLTADATASSDAFGTIVEYRFDFGDGTVVTGGAPIVTHDYANAGSYQVTVTVTDDRGFSSVAIQNVVTNFAPVASFAIDVTESRIPFSVNVDASGSSDANGTIVSYEWNFGDGTTTTGMTASHEYTTIGTYTVSLTVTDDQGATSTVTETVDAQPPLPPVIDQQPLSIEVFEGNSVSFSVSASGFGPLTYQWRRNGVDIAGVVGTTYTIGNVLSINNGDEYTVVVTNLGGSITSDVATLSIVLPNQLPTADFTFEQLGASLQIAFDAAASSDADGSIVSYDWGFGDGSTATGVNPTHTYTAEGTYTVTLTVTDDDGDSTSTDMTFDVAFPIVSVVAAGANLADGARVIDRLPDGSLDLSTFWVNDHVTATAWVTIDLGSSQTIGEAHLAPRTDRAYNIEVVVGDTLVNGKVQAAPAAVCATPDLGPATPTETIPCTFAPVTGRYVTLESTDVASFRLHGAEFFNATPLNQEPMPAFSATQTPPDSLTVVFDASASVDVDGAIVAYDWDFGDGNTGSGPMPTHTYGGADNYQVTLTVTDNDGGVGVLQQIVAAGVTVPTGKAAVTVAAVGGRASSQGLIIDESGDGSQNLLTQWTSGGNAANTWFTLDLGTSEPVAKLFIAPRRDREYQLMIFVGDELDGGKVDGVTPVTCVTADLDTTRPEALLECALPTTMGRYVTVMADQNFRVYGAEVHVELTPPTEPVAQFTSAQDGADPLTLIFDASGSSDSNGSIVAYDWDFGDGNTSTDAMPSHTYSVGGDFTVTLTVTDNDGETASATQSVFAGEAPDEEQVAVTVEAVGVRASASDRAIDTLGDGSQDLSTHWNDSGNLNKSWITLDLGAERELTQLLLAPRDNRDYDFEIRVGNSLDNDGEVTGGVDATCTLLGNGGNVPTMLRVCGMTEGLIGRYVSIRNVGTKTLRIYGLEVYARRLN
ncbi:MAG: PKD domain-containing protein, partial [Pseudomonadota bacterium]